MNRRRLLQLAGVVLAIGGGLPGCAVSRADGAEVQVLVAAKARGGETVANMRTRVFGQVQIGDTVNLGQKVGWLVWSSDIAGDIVVLNETHTVAPGEMITTEAADDLTGDYTGVEPPEAWVLNEGDAVAFFMLDFQTIAIAEGGEKFAELLVGRDSSEVVVIRAGKVLESVDFDTDTAEVGDELLVFGGKITA